MGDCPECERKDRQIRFLHAQSEHYRHDADMWKRHLFHVQNTVRGIRDSAQEAMWYPSTYSVRGETGVTAQEKAWCEVQHDRPHCVETDR